MGQKPTRPGGATAPGTSSSSETGERNEDPWLKDGEAVERGKGKGKDKAQSFTDKISQLLVDGDSRRKRQ